MLSQPDFPNGVSVVVATHNRASLVVKLLDSLAVVAANTSLPTEVLIVDSSPPPAATMICQACERTHAQYIAYLTNNVRRKRNAGIDHARYDIVLFVDSDCVAAPNLFEEHCGVYGDKPDIGGVIGVTRFVGPISTFWSIVEKTSLLDAFTYAEHHATVPWGPTSNISYRRDLLLKVGKFDESFPFALGGDDTDLGLRITDDGYKIICNPRAAVEHARETWDGPLLIGKRVFRWGRMHFHLLAKHQHRVYYDFPKALVVGLLLVATSIPVALLRQQALWLLAPLLWLTAELLLESALIVKMLRYPWQVYGVVLGARMFSLVFDLGTLAESVAHRSLRPAYMEISYTPPSLQGRYRRIAQLWSSVLITAGFLALLAIM